MVVFSSMLFNVLRVSFSSSLFPESQQLCIWTFEWTIIQQLTNLRSYVTALIKTLLHTMHPYCGVDLLP